MSKPTVPILFTSAGRRVELARCFRQAATSLGWTCEVHACDLNPALSAACHDADYAFSVPRCDDADYIDILLEYCRTHAIRLLVPTIDPELMPLALARERFMASGTWVHVSGPATIAIARDKQKTIEVLGQAGVPVPRTAAPADVRKAPEGWSWPMFIKPSGGSASRGLGLIQSPSDILDDYPEAMIVQELLKGDEFTVNLYVDANGRLVTAIPHKRLSVRAGEVEKGATVFRRDIREIAEKLVAALPDPTGVMCFQLIDDVESGPRVFEINARFGGGYPLADRAGGRFAESLLARVTGKAECANDEWRENVLMMRFDAAVYCD
jgi:carbamoyl-phosphate synthase large subunit